MNKFDTLYEALLQEKAKYLKTYKIPLDVYNGGEKTDSKYYVAIKVGDSRFDKGEDVFVLVKDPKKPEKTAVSGGWLLKSLLYSKRPIKDSLYIDAGQEWYVSGLDKVRAQLEKDFPKGDWDEPDLKFPEIK
jgi:hypothetical protein